MSPKFSVWRWFIGVGTAACSASCGAVIEPEVEATEASITINTFSATASNSRITLSWNLDAPPTALQIFGSGGIWRADGLTVKQDVGSVTASQSGSTSFHVKSAGVHRFTLLAVAADGSKATRTAEITLGAVMPPGTVPNYAAAQVTDVPYFDNSDRTLSWTKSPSVANENQGCVVVYEPEAFFPKITNPSGSTWCAKYGFAHDDDIPVPRASLVGGDYGRYTYGLQACEDDSSPASNRPICSDVRPVTFMVTPTPFVGPFRKFLPSAAQSYQVSWTMSWVGTGNAWYLQVPTKGWRSTLISYPQTSYTFPANFFSDGVHQIWLSSCQQGQPTTCSDPPPVKPPVSGGLYTLLSSNTPVTQGQRIGWVLANGTSYEALAPAAGSFFRSAALESFVSPASPTVPVTIDTELGIVLSSDYSKYSMIELVVGKPQSVATWTEVQVTDDYTYEQFAYPRNAAAGHPLDVTFETVMGNDIWGFGEFSNGVVQVDVVNDAGTGTWFEIPLVRTLGAVDPVKPFAGGTHFLTARAERITRGPNGTIWFVQGGWNTDAEPNHSRLVHYDPARTDSTSTAYDERFCVIHVPDLGSPSDIRSNTQTLGVEWEPVSQTFPRGRIWIAEARPYHESAVIGWLEPPLSGVQCDNLLNYTSPSAVENADKANTCGRNLSDPNDPEDKPYCITEIPLVDTNDISFGPVAQMRWDTKGDGATSNLPCLWFTGYYGTLGRYCPSVGLKYWELPEKHRTDYTGLIPFEGYPWQLVVDDDAVYVVEYRDNDLVRFDKAKAAAGNDPWSELYVPVPWRLQNMHSVAIDGRKLYFTMANEKVPDDDNFGASYFGVVDLDTWKNKVANASNPPITGTIYKDMSSSLGTGYGDGPLHSFRGIDVSDDGYVALADDGKAAGYFRLKPQ